MFETAKNYLKSELRRYHQQRRLTQIKATARPVTKSEIIFGLRELGLKSGDTVMLHSSLKSIGYVPGGPTEVIDALLEALAPSGTLVVPTYYQPGGTILSTCQIDGYYFDPRLHGTNLGALPSAFLRYTGVERSIHPTHSVSALGARAQYITEAHHHASSIFGQGSPWQRCLESDAKILGLGVSMGPITFYHLLEDTLGDNFPLPVHLQETYSLPCRDWNNKEILVPVRPFDPLYVRRRIDAPGRNDLREYFWHEFTRTHLVATGKVGDALSWLIPAKQLYAHLSVLLADGVTIYSTTQELERRPFTSQIGSAPAEPNSVTEQINNDRAESLSHDRRPSILR